MKILKVGIIPSDLFRQRIIDISLGKYKPKESEPKLWFSNLRYFNKILNSKNLELIKFIAIQKSDTFEKLSDLSGIDVKSLKKRIKVLVEFGLITLNFNKLNGQTKLTAENIKIEITIINSL